MTLEGKQFTVDTGERCGGEGGGSRAASEP